MPTEAVVAIVVQLGGLGVLAVFLCWVLPALVDKVIKTLEKRDEAYIKVLDKLGTVVERNNKVVDRSNMAVDRLAGVIEKQISKQEE